MENIYFYSIGIIFFFFGVAVSISRTRLFLTGVRVNGIIVEMVIRHRTGPGTAGSKCAKIIYDDPNGECKEFVDQNNLVGSLYKEDQQITLLIDIKNNNRIVVNGFFSLYVPSMCLFLFSAVSLYMAAQ
ncbi:MAG: hypothetical protein HRU20_17925 [Pseudomonadales bacterium]|nr:hypothetical protein [Pseudomonadales bacterium]